MLWWYVYVKEIIFIVWKILGFIIENILFEDLCNDGLIVMFWKSMDIIMMIMDIKVIVWISGCWYIFICIFDKVFIKIGWFWEFYNVMV